jgi:UDP-4-amino-4,6-dideoxy-N-acetyl-beta-L-altrosamine N-acetyltransferase
MFWHDGVCFKPVERDDLEMIRAMRNEPSTYLQLTDVSQISEAQQQKWFESLDSSQDKAYFSVFKERQEFPISTAGDFLGIVRFDQIDRTNKSVRVGLDIVPHERSKGYGTKTFGAILKYCFDHWAMHRLWLCVLDDNEVAQKLYTFVGFTTEGIMKEAIFRDGKWKDYIVMSILEDDYRNKNK